VPTERQSVIRSVVEGVRYLGVTRILLATMSLDFLATFFGSPRALFPYYAERVFHVGPEGLGLLYASMGAGALVAALASGWTARIQRQGLTVLVAVVVWGLAIALFGVLDQPWFVLALVLLAIANAADVVSSIFRGTILQLVVPDALRGRLNAINIMFVVGGPQLGQFESGAVAALWSPVSSVVSGGLACVLSVFAIAAWIPETVRYRAHRDEITAAEAERLAPAQLVISPGPGRPADAGASIEIIRRLAPTTPTLGVCLGHQAIVEAFGGEVGYARELLHGKASPVRHDGTGLFTGLPEPFDAGR